MDDKPWEAKTQIDFISRAYQWNLWKGYAEGVPCWLYNLGRDHKLLAMDFGEFQNILRDRHVNYTHGRFHEWQHGYRWRRYARSFMFSPENYRRQRKFKQTGHKRKKADTVRNDWWEFKQFTRDRGRVNYSRGSTGRNWKFFTKRKHRQLERRALQKEKYELLHSHSYQDAEDLWSWD